MAASSTEFTAIILAGGSGKRLWPLSTEERPKQFLTIFGGKSLLRQTYDRLKGLADSVRVITAARLKRETERELKGIPKRDIIGEPMKRDTGAAVALGAGLVKAGVVGFFPADQLVGNDKRFAKCVRKAIAMAKKRDVIVTIGIKPTSPSTAFGYIDPQGGKFVEKPSLPKARSYVRRGYLWNAGIFIAKSSVLRETIARYAPKLAKVKLADYPKLPKISFDYAVMEKLDEVAVVKGDFGWDDVGSYAALARHFPDRLDANGNLIINGVMVPRR